MICALTTVNQALGEMVSLTSIPPGLLEGLPQEDQNAIVAIVGKPVLLVGYDEDGRAELHFDDPFDGRTDDYSQAASTGGCRPTI